MDKSSFKNISSRLGIRHLFLFAAMALMLFVTSCVSSSYNGQKNWHRAPASTGRNRCGCLLNPHHDHVLKLYKQPVYALQA